jgi:hypothetical protein
MAYNENEALNLIGDNAFVRKTDDSLIITTTNQDGSNFSAGTYTFYLTVRKSIPKTSIVNDSDSEVIIQKTSTVVLASPALTLQAQFDFTQTDLDIEPKLYYYDIKYNDPSNLTTSITKGYKQFSVVADITRRNT